MSILELQEYCKELVANSSKYVYDSKLHTYITELEKEIQTLVGLRKELYGLDEFTVSSLKRGVVSLIADIQEYLFISYKVYARELCVRTLVEQVFSLAYEACKSACTAGQLPAFEDICLLKSASKVKNEDTYRILGKFEPTVMDELLKGVKRYGIRNAALEWVEKSGDDFN